MIEKIKHWAEDKSSFYFFLPDGPLGKPCDNQYSIENLTKDENGFKIYFSYGIIINIIGTPTISNKENKIVISDFQDMRLIVEEKIIKTYSSGNMVINGF